MMHNSSGMPPGATADRAADGPRSVEELIALTAAGRRVKYVRFWGHRPPRDGGVGVSCFSQWWPAPFTVDGVRYATAEHWMMAGKARLFGDADAERRAIAAVHPKQAKDAGRTVRGFDEEVWRQHRFALVVEGSMHKFGQHDALRRFLLSTNSRVLAAVTSAASGRGQPGRPHMGHRPRRRRRARHDPGPLARPEPPRLRADGGPTAPGGGNGRRGRAGLRGLRGGVGLSSTVGPGGLAVAGPGRTWRPSGTSPPGRAGARLPPPLIR